VELERLTNDDASDDEITAVGVERRYLKRQLKKLRAEDAEAHYDLQGEEWSFEVELGHHALLDGLPGRPSVVWLRAASNVLGSLQSWKTTHSVGVKKGNVMRYFSLRCCLAYLVYLFFDIC
jgi:hypothetical protein